MKVRSTGRASSTMTRSLAQRARTSSAHKAAKLSLCSIHTTMDTMLSITVISQKEGSICFSTRHQKARKIVTSPSNVNELIGARVGSVGSVQLGCLSSDGLAREHARWESVA